MTYKDLSISLTFGSVTFFLLLHILLIEETAVIIWKLYETTSAYVYA